MSNNDLYDVLKRTAALIHQAKIDWMGKNNDEAERHWRIAARYLWTVLRPELTDEQVKAVLNALRRGISISEAVNLNDLKRLFPNEIERYLESGQLPDRLDPYKIREDIERRTIGNPNPYHEGPEDPEIGEDDGPEL